MANWPGRRPLSFPFPYKSRGRALPRPFSSFPHRSRICTSSILALAPSPLDSDRRRRCCHADSLTRRSSGRTSIAQSFTEPSHTSSAPSRHRRPTGTPLPPRTAAGRRNPPPPAILPSASVQGENLQVFPIIFSSFSPIYSSSSCLRSPAPPKRRPPLERPAGALPSPPIRFSGAPPSLPSPQVKPSWPSFQFGSFSLTRRPCWPPPASWPASPPPPGIARRRLEGSRGCPPACIRPPPPDLI
jgi:hypothetical protein